MFERFTDRARRVVMLAQEEARAFQHNYIGTEHLLLGLQRENEGLGGQALTALGVDLDSTRTEVEGMVGRGSDQPTGHMPFTPRAKKVLELSLRQALKLSHNYIGTEHILLGLVNEGEGIAAQILSQKVDGGLAAVEDEIMGKMVGAGAVQKGEVFQEQQRRRMERGVVTAVESGDEVARRLEAIEARLTAIERLLRGERDQGTA